MNLTNRNWRLAAWLTAYIASIILANWMVEKFGLVSIGLGLLVPAGTFAAGAALVLRDAVQIYGTRWWVLGAIFVGAAISFFMASPAIAVASALAFLVSEMVDWAVFTPLRPRNLALAVVVASVVAAPVDTVLFLVISGLGLSWQAVVGQVLVKTFMALIAAFIITLRRKRFERAQAEVRELADHG